MPPKERLPANVKRGPLRSIECLLSVFCIGHMLPRAAHTASSYALFFHKTASKPKWLHATRWLNVGATVNTLREGS
jgi:hypothetical protein